MILHIISCACLGGQIPSTSPTALLFFPKRFVEESVYVPFEFTITAEWLIVESREIVWFDETIVDTQFFVGVHFKSARKNLRWSHIVGQLSRRNFAFIQSTTIPLGNSTKLFRQGGIILHHKIVVVSHFVNKRF